MSVLGFSAVCDSPLLRADTRGPDSSLAEQGRGSAAAEGPT